MWLFDLHTFLAEHAVTERHLRKDCIFVEGPGQHRAGVCRQALSTQVQPGAQSSPPVLELSHDTLLGLHSALLTQAQVRPPEVLHCESPVSPLHLTCTTLSLRFLSLLYGSSCWLKKKRLNLQIKDKLIRLIDHQKKILCWYLINPSSNFQANQWKSSLEAFELLRFGAFIWLVIVNRIFLGFGLLAEQNQTFEDIMLSSKNMMDISYNLMTFYGPMVY